MRLSSLIFNVVNESAGFDQHRPREPLRPQTPRVPLVSKDVSDTERIAFIDLLSVKLYVLSGMAHECQALRRVLGDYRPAGNQTSLRIAKRSRVRGQ